MRRHARLPLLALSGAACALLLSVAAPAPALADDGTCSSIRTVRALAEHHALDETSLKALEAIYCGDKDDQEPQARSRKEPRGDHAQGAERSNSQECGDLTVLALLVDAQGGDAAQWRNEIDAMQQVSCSMGEGLGDVSWKSGLSAHYNDGSWNYPSGMTAQYADGSWNYPSGMTAKYSDGSWNYPSGMTAKYSNGSWNLPSGMSAESANDVLSVACERAGEEWCGRVLRHIRRSESDEKTAIIIGFAWQALAAE